MSGTIETRGGCCRGCSSCLDFICSIPSCIQNFPCRRCVLALLVLTIFHYVRSVMIILSVVLVTVSWTEFQGRLSIIVCMYAVCLILCLVLTFIKPQGSCNYKIRLASQVEKRQQKLLRQGKQRARQQNPYRQSGPGARQQNPYRQSGPGSRQQNPYRQSGQKTRYPIQHQPEGTEQLRTEASSNPIEQRPAICPERRHVQEVPFDFHRAEECSESSNAFEPASSSSDEPLQQAATSDLASNLPQSSTDPSTKSTRSTPLDDIASEYPHNDESLQKAVPSDAGNNLAQSTANPSTKSTYSKCLDDTSEVPYIDESLRQTVPSDLGNLTQSSTDPSTNSTRSTHLDDTNEDPDIYEPLEQAVSSDSGSNLSSTDPPI